MYALNPGNAIYFCARHQVETLFKKTKKKEELAHSGAGGQTIGGSRWMWRLPVCRSHDGDWKWVKRRETPAFVLRDFCCLHNSRGTEEFLPSESKKKKKTVSTQPKPRAAPSPFIQIISPIPHSTLLCCFCRRRLEEHECGREEELGLRWEDAKKALCLLTRELQQTASASCWVAVPVFHISLKKPRRTAVRLGRESGSVKKRMQTNTSGGKTE